MPFLASATMLAGCGMEVGGDTTSSAIGGEPRELGKNVEYPEGWPPDVVAAIGDAELSLRAWVTPGCERTGR